MKTRPFEKVAGEIDEIVVWCAPCNFGETRCKHRLAVAAIITREVNKAIRKAAKKVKDFNGFESAHCAGLVLSLLLKPSREVKK